MANKCNFTLTSRSQLKCNHTQVEPWHSPQKNWRRAHLDIAASKTVNKSHSKECEKCGNPSDNFASCSASSDLFRWECDNRYQYTFSKLLLKFTYPKYYISSTKSSPNVPRSCLKWSNINVFLCSAELHLENINETITYYMNFPAKALYIIVNYVCNHHYKVKAERTYMVKWINCQGPKNQDKNKPAADAKANKEEWVELVG